jgi:hypothetical protein
VRTVNGTAASVDYSELNFQLEEGPELMIDTHGGPGSDGYVYIYIKVRSLTAVLYGGKMYPRLTTGRSHMSQRALMVYGPTQVVMSMPTYVPPVSFQSYTKR